MTLNKFIKELVKALLLLRGFAFKQVSCRRKYINVNLFYKFDVRNSTVTLRSYQKSSNLFKRGNSCTQSDTHRFYHAKIRKALKG